MEVIITTVLPLLSGLLGYLAWNGGQYALALAPLVTCLWAMAKSKPEAFLIILSYYLAVSFGLIKGAGVFFGKQASSSLVLGVTMCLVPCGFLSLIWAMLWSKQGRWWRVTLIILILSIPPIGLFGWANLVTAAGILFPGSSSGLGCLLHCCL